MSETIDHKLRLDLPNNRIIIPMDYVNVRDHKIYVPINLIRQVLPPPEKLEDKLEWLDQILYEIKKGKLVNLKTYYLEVDRLARGQAEIRKNVKDITDKIGLERAKLIAKSWLDEKNILKEGRLVFRLLKFEEAEIEEKRARVLAGLD